MTAVRDAAMAQISSLEQRIGELFQLKEKERNQRKQSEETLLMLEHRVGSFGVLAMTRIKIVIRCTIFVMKLSIISPALSESSTVYSGNYHLRVNRNIFVFITH